MFDAHEQGRADDGRIRWPWVRARFEVGASTTGSKPTTASTAAGSSVHDRTLLRRGGTKHIEVIMLSRSLEGMCCLLQLIYCRLHQFASRHRRRLSHLPPLADRQ